jgi:hypothetical protein
MSDYNPDNLVWRLRNGPDGLGCLSPDDEFAADAIESLQKQLEEAQTELDEASPFMQCARCGKPTRVHKLVAEEWDEWECYPCNDRENKRERST